MKEPRNSEPIFAKNETQQHRYRSKRHRPMFPRVPAESDVDCHFVDLSLVRQAFVAGVGQEGQPFVVRKLGVVEARSTTLQPDKSLRR